MSKPKEWLLRKETVPYSEGASFPEGYFVVIEKSTYDELKQLIEDYCYEAGGNEIEESKKRDCREALRRHE